MLSGPVVTLGKKVKWSRYRPGVAQRVGRGISLLFHDCGTRRGWIVSSTPRPHFTPGKDPVPILQEAGWAPGPVWTGGKARLHRDSIPDRPARSQSLYRLSYPAHSNFMYHVGNERTEVQWGVLDFVEWSRRLTHCCHSHSRDIIWYHCCLNQSRSCAEMVAKFTGHT